MHDTTVKSTLTDFADNKPSNCVHRERGTKQKDCGIFATDCPDETMKTRGCYFSEEDRDKMLGRQHDKQD
jgi:hypothetical protein